MEILTRAIFPSTAAGVDRAATLRRAARSILARTARRRLSICFVLALFFSGLATTGRAAEIPREYDVKSALLFNFTQFVTWPGFAFASDDAPLVIGVLGHDPFGTSLDRIVGDEHIGTHRIVVERCRDVADAARCHIVFIGLSERGELADILSALENRPVLTVADFDGFLQRGGMVQFRKNSENKIRVRINLEAARHAKLTLSAKLLRVVEVISPQEL